jgi:hypothetical protein
MEIDELDKIMVYWFMLVADLGDLGLIVVCG